LSSNTRVPRNRIIFQELCGNLQIGQYFLQEMFSAFKLIYNLEKNLTHARNYLFCNPNHKYKIILYISITYNFYCA